MSITNTPWRADDSESTAISAIVNGVTFWIADFAGTPGPDDEHAADNRDRAVACVNACDGLDTQLLIDLVADGTTLKNIMRRGLICLEQRDELLKALETIAGANAGNTSTTPLIHIAKDAIARVKGGAA